MQSDTPQGDPRLQRIYPGPEIATGFIDPCIVYLETTLAGEIPLLAACWAGSSREICEPGSRPYLELQDVVVIQNQSDKRIGSESLWKFDIRLAKTVLVSRTDRGRGTALCPYVTENFAIHQMSPFRCVVRQLDRQTHDSLRRIMWNPSRNSVSIVQAILESATVEWFSIANALASPKALAATVPIETVAIERARNPQSDWIPDSLIRRLLSSIFKKPQPAHA
jgi:hypothetical protein